MSSMSDGGVVLGSRVLASIVVVGAGGEGDVGGRVVVLVNVVLAVVGVGACGPTW
jgi:hypothetical protein